MKELVEIIAIVGIWLLISQFLLPKLGIPT